MVKQSRDWLKIKDYAKKAKNVVKTETKSVAKRTSRIVHNVVQDEKQDFKHNYAVYAGEAALAATFATATVATGGADLLLAPAFAVGEELLGGAAINTAARETDRTLKKHANQDIYRMGHIALRVLPTALKIKSLAAATERVQARAGTYASSKVTQEGLNLQKRSDKKLAQKLDPTPTHDQLHDEMHQWRKNTWSEVESHGLKMDKDLSTRDTKVFSSTNGDRPLILSKSQQGTDEIWTSIQQDQLDKHVNNLLKEARSKYHTDTFNEYGTTLSNNSSLIHPVTSMTGIPIIPPPN